MKTKRLLTRISTPVGLLLGTILSTTTAQANLVDITVTIENLAPTDTLAFAPLRVGFHSGVYDAFDNGTAASDAIISIAEGGSGSEWFPAFEAADPTAVLGTVVNGGPALPAGNAGNGNPFSSTATNTFRVDTSVNAFFTFANMVVPSNDLFLGNDSAIRLFDDEGNLLIDQIFQSAADIWDANSEVADPSAAAFVQGGVNGDRTPENGLIAFDFSELGVFDGLTTAAGYNFDFDALDPDTGIYSITFSATDVPVSAPATLAMLSLGIFGMVMFQRQKK